MIKMAEKQLYCWRCIFLPGSCTCPGFRQLLNTATRGLKIKNPICDRCPFLGLSRDACVIWCNKVTNYNEGFRQVYEMATSKKIVGV